MKGDIKEIKNACKKIQTINQNMMLAASSDVEAKLSAEVGNIDFFFFPSITQVTPSS